MYLKDLQISGFKSFAKKGELEFQTPITAIVGPNGSGKSNVAEAFRFVLGEQASSKMRGKKGEDLIWNGTDKIKRSNRASVTLTLNNETRVFPLDFDEIIVERVVHRDGQNEYRINGSLVRLKDVQELMAAANIGPSGHHMISQGEADRVLRATPKERREMIEDALGLKVYQYKKAEAERKLERTKENIQEVELKRKEVAPHLKFLAKEVNKMERAEKLKQELSQFYSEYLYREDVYLTLNQERLEAKKAEQEAWVAKLDSNIALAEDKIKKEGQADQYKEALGEAKSLIDQARENQSSLEKEKASINGKIDYLSRRIQDAKASARKDTKPAYIPYSEFEKVLKEAERQVESVNTDTEPGLLKRTLTDVVNSLRHLLRQSTNTEIIDTKSEEEEKQKLEAELRELEGKIKKANDALEEALSKYRDLEQEKEEQLSEAREAEKELYSLKEQKRQYETTLQTVSYELQAIERDREEFKAELQEAVVLLGRSASQYMNLELKDASGNVVSNEVVATEDRESQRERKRQLEKMKIRLEELGGYNEDLKKEYEETKARDDFLQSEIKDLETSVLKLENLIKELNDELDKQFSVGIEKIDAEFNRFFTLMFGGGKASLETVKIKKRVSESEESNEGDAEEGKEEIDEKGINLSVSLPGKRVTGLDMLSGGERALTSIALIFAMSQVNPPLFVVLDETDAALDEANSRRYGDMIEALAKRSQLILITHNRETMRRAGILYGVTMQGDGVSTLLSVKLDQALETAK